MTSNPHLTLELRAERRLIGPTSHRHVHVRVHVDAQPTHTQTERAPLAIGLVLDRSGSMHGDKIETARRAALAVLDRLDQRDRVAAVIFDHQIDVLQTGAPATDEVKARLRAELSAVRARGNTALHEGWLSGCRAIAPEHIGAQVARCFLLTDGLANVGQTDPEQIAAEAAGVREHAGVGTSTFGIGTDYDENLLGPLAVAGGGQFHNLRTADEIARTFLGELGELLSVAAINVRLELELSSGMSTEVVSPYWPRQTAPTTWSVALGDLLAGEERNVVLRFGFEQALATALPIVRARLVWTDGSSAWQELGFERADSAARAAEPADAHVLRMVGQHHAERAQRQAVARSREGDVAGAQRLLKRVAERISTYAADDPELRAALDQLAEAERGLQQHGYAPAAAKERYFSTQASSRGQRDLRTP